jgi:hypothetical protein
VRRVVCVYVVGKAFKKRKEKKKSRWPREVFSSVVAAAAHCYCYCCSTVTATASAAGKGVVFKVTGASFHEPRLYLQMIHHHHHTLTASNNNNNNNPNNNNNNNSK